MKSYKISVIGAGYVGLSLGILLAKNNDVTFIEKSSSKRKLLVEKKFFKNEKLF
tara:strand:+ start:612 stop:773 length:162 start_codon:yes stop_codon:yes gene_type:complete